MGPDEGVLRTVYDHARGQCECRMPICHHEGRCAAHVQFADYGRTWQVMTLEPAADDSSDPNDYFLLCSDPINRHGCFEVWREHAGRMPAEREPQLA